MDMTGNQPTDEDRALLAFLQAQRDAVLSIVAGLDEEAWHRSVVPSGWTPAGLVEPLLQRPAVVAGAKLVNVGVRARNKFCASPHPKRAKRVV
jgi:hypothetical protein